MSKGVSALLFFIGSPCLSFYYLSLESVLGISIQNLKFAAVLILLYKIQRVRDSCTELCWGTQREYRSKSLKHSIVKRILVFKQ